MWWMVGAALGAELLHEGSVWTTELVQLSLHERATGPAVAVDVQTGIPRACSRRRRRR